MLKLWREEFTRTDRPTGGTLTSVVVHMVLITLAVLATNPPEGFVQGLYSLANRVIYVAPPPRIANAEGSKEQLQYTDVAPIGDGSGFARGPIGAEISQQPVLLSPRPGDLGTEKTPSVESRRFASYDTVFTFTEVDSAVIVDPASAAPTYPPALLKLGIEGSVMVRYVVDSLGHADVSTLEVIRASRVEFAMAVREVLPFMRFTPARMGPKAVPQLVEQPFNFRIRKPDTAAAAVPKKPPVP
jgi:TonB family protein